MHILVCDDDAAFAAQLLLAISDCFIFTIIASFFTSIKLSINI